MAKPLLIARQSSAPKGFFGRILLGFMGRETKRFNTDVLAALNVSDGDRVLEVGFGHGRTIDTAARAVPGATFAGVDISADALRVAQRRCKRWIASGRVELVAGDAAALPWADASFSKAFTVHTIYFWTDPSRCLDELRRVMRPLGTLVIGFRERTATAEAQLPSSIYRLYSSDDVAAMLVAAGFDVEQRIESGAEFRIVVARKR
jgi:ubiquinone/menaquinone biosynthesis C-methylase UbiE